jgi:Zn-dependent peptidase ImmA (M78 family)
MNDPIAKARWVTKTYNITGIPALALQAIADQEKIKCIFSSFPNDSWLSGMLLYKGEKRKIIINTLIQNVGRHNFTFAHELGHYFMNHTPSFYINDQKGFRCTFTDIEKGQKPREVEANRFAAELLMPKNRFQLDMTGAPIDFYLINSLANLYMVSKYACSNRILNLLTTPCIVVLIKGQSITGFSESCAARKFLKKMNKVPDDTAAFSVIVNRHSQENFESCDATKWLLRTIPGNIIYECTHVDRNGSTAMTILKW